jgi:spore coat protein CotH
VFDIYLNACTALIYAAIIRHCWKNTCLLVSIFIFLIINKFKGIGQWAVRPPDRTFNNKLSLHLASIKSVTIQKQFSYWLQQPQDQALNVILRECDPKFPKRKGGMKAPMHMLFLGASFTTNARILKNI